MNYRLLVYLCCLSLLSLSNAFAESSKTRVGISIPLTGFVAQMGEAYKNGAEMYLEEHKPDDLEVIFDDHRYDGKQVMSSLRFLQDQKDVDLLVVWGNTPTEVAAPAAESAKLPLIGLTNSTHGKDRNYVLTFGNPLTTWTDKVGEFFIERGAKNPAAVTVNIGNALEALEKLKEKTPNFSTIEVVDNDLTDFRTIIAKLKSRKVDVLSLLLLPEQAFAFAKQAKALNYDVPIVGGDVWADVTVLSELNKNFSDVSFAYGEVDKAFMDRFKKRNGNLSFVFEAACGYQVLALIDSLPANWKELSLYDAFAKTDFANSVVTGLVLKNDKEFGPHFFAQTKIYEGLS